jgi:tetratricopeptide (TPR) repeat protein
MASDAAKMQPSEANLQELIDVQIRLQRYEDAIESCRELFAVAGETYAGSVAMAASLASLGRFEQAQPFWEVALKSSPDAASTLFQKGSIFSVWGMFEEAEAEFCKSLQAKPMQGAAYHAVFSSRRVTSNDADLIHQAQSAMNSVPSLDPNERRYLNFGLGKAFDDLGEQERAIKYYDEGNRLVREIFFKSQPCPTELIEEPVRQNSELFSREFLSEQAYRGVDSDLPIFVVGMMRSGTSLVEQILSSHPEVGGAGEQMFWARLAPNFVDYESQSIRWPAVNRGISEYENLLRYVAPGFERIVDKNPRNLMQIGLIHAAFPRAKIVYVRRSDIDVAISIWTTLINTDAPFMGDRKAVVQAIRAARRMFKHWQEVVSSGTMLEVCYEDLVTDPEATIRMLITFCGLSWNDACLHPESTRRSVRTPSVTQVRQTINARSVGRYQRYGPWLGPFAQLLEP